VNPVADAASDELRSDVEQTASSLSEGGANEPVVADAPESGDRSDESQQVPVWLAALVLVLLLAVMAVGGFVLRGVIDNEPRATSVADLDIAKWEDEVKLNPDDTEAHLNLGFAYQQAERFEEALAQYDFVIGRVPGDTAALYNRGVVLLALDREPEAEETWWSVLEVEPGHVLAAKSLGEYYASRREFRSLIEAVRPVVEQNESSADLQYLMGLAYENLGNTDWARARYQLALKYYPDMQEAQEGLDRLGVEQ